MKTIAFYSQQMGLRGTEVTMYDFAHYNETILGNKSVIIYSGDNPRNHPSAIEKFTQRFPVFSVPGNAENDPQELNADLNKIIEQTGSEYFYIQKKGNNDGVCPSAAKCLILCCGLVDPSKERHGHKYAFISYWLSKVCSNNTVPVVPSIIQLPDINEDLRESLNIPKDAVVFGRTGGEDTWNLPFTDDVIKYALKYRKNIYFLLQNTPQCHVDDPRVIRVPSTSSMIFKTKFINTCDAMLHSRNEGESFGMACGEFSLRNKPVITYGLSRERNHIEVLGDKGIYFNNPQELSGILLGFVPKNNVDYNCYRDYSPEKVMKIFNEVYLND